MANDESGPWHIMLDRYVQVISQHGSRCWHAVRLITKCRQRRGMSRLCNMTGSGHALFRQTCVPHAAGLHASKAHPAALGAVVGQKPALASQGLVGRHPLVVVGVGAACLLQE